MASEITVSHSVHYTSVSRDLGEECAAFTHSQVPATERLDSESQAVIIL